MIKVDNIDTFGFDTAIRAMRNPMNSWEKSDTIHGTLYKLYDGEEILSKDGFSIGENDLDLMKRLFNAGVEHRTYARMMMVSMDITAPLYWWKEMDRYRFKEQISTSTMHKIHSKEFELNDFSHDHMTQLSTMMMYKVIDVLNVYRSAYIDLKDKDTWWQLIQLLPSSYNQKRTVMMSYETVFKIIKERSGHKLDEWRDFVSILIELPYVKEIMEVQ